MLEDQKMITAEQAFQIAREYFDAANGQGSAKTPTLLKKANLTFRTFNFGFGAVVAVASESDEILNKHFITNGLHQGTEMYIGESWHEGYIVDVGTEMFIAVLERDGKCCYFLDNHPTK